MILHVYLGVVLYLTVWHIRQPCLQLATQNRNNISGTISNACPNQGRDKGRGDIKRNTKVDSD